MKLGKKTNTNQYMEKINDKTPFTTLESYKSIRTNLQFTMAGSDKKSIVISSALPVDSKSITCANLAITFAMTNAKVLLIDADLRKPAQHKIFKVDNKHGLSSLLVGFATLEEAVLKDVEANLDVITSGPIPPNPSELLGSIRMEELLSKLSESYDYILIDAPPINVVTDAVLLAAKTAGVAIVLKHNITTYSDVQLAFDAISRANAKVLGVILNNVYEKNKGNDKYRYEYKQL